MFSSIFYCYISYCKTNTKICILDIVGSITYIVLLNSIYYDTYWKKAISMSHIKPTAPQNMIEKEFPLDSKGLLLLFLLPRSLVRINLWKRTWYLWSFRARVILPPSCMYWCQTIYTQTNVLLPNKIYLPIHSIY